MRRSPAYFSILAAAFSLLFLGGVAYAVNSNTASITFPVEELGNCGSRDACRAYCDQSDHIEDCARFGAAHGLARAEDVARAQKFSTTLKTGGPGGCQDAAGCVQFCEDTSHAQECLTFAEKNKLLDKDELAKLKKLHGTLDGGLEGPGGCTSKRACLNYCQATAHLDECLAFAEKHGLLKPDDLKRAHAFQEALKNGTTPGSCDSRETCEAYCKQAAHRDECIAFAKASGAADAATVELLQKTDGRGPGECNSRVSCEAYCNQAEHQQACLDFARTHRLIESDDLETIKEGANRLQAGLRQVPAAVADCLKTEAGIDAALLDTRTLTPDSDTAEKVKMCFSQHKEELKSKLEDELGNHPDLQACIAQAGGTALLKQIKDGAAPSDSEAALKIRKCFENLRDREQPDRSLNRDENSETRPQGPPGGDSQSPGPTNLDELRAQIRLRRACLQPLLGLELLEKVEAGELPADTQVLKTALQKCADHATPPTGSSGASQFQRPPTPPPTPITPQNSAYELCRRQVMGDSTAAVTASPELQEQMRQCLASHLPEVKGASTTNTFEKFLLWLFGP